jgi:Domain of Unknown Function (DUF1206)
MFDGLRVWVDVSMATASLNHRTSGPLGNTRPAFVWLGRLGWLAKGVVYVLAGVLATAVAARSVGWSSTVAPDGEASPTGAIKEIATFTGGRVLLLGLAAGLLLYSLWRLYTAFAPGGSGAEAVAMRIGYGVSAILYLTFSLTAFALARRPTTSADGNQKVVDVSAQVMSHSAGRWAIALAGLIAIGAGLYRIAKGVKGDVQTELNLAGVSQERRLLIKRLGILGEIGCGIAISLIGYFLLRSGLDVKPQEATGLDGALRSLTVNSWGSALVTVVGVGFVAYGIFCLLTFTHRQLRHRHDRNADGVRPSGHSRLPRASRSWEGPASTAYSWLMSALRRRSTSAESPTCEVA